MALFEWIADLVLCYICHAIVHWRSSACLIVFSEVVPLLCDCATGLSNSCNDQKPPPGEGNLPNLFDSMNKPECVQCRSSFVTSASLSTVHIKSDWYALYINIIYEWRFVSCYCLWQLGVVFVSGSRTGPAPSVRPWRPRANDQPNLVEPKHH